MNRIDYDQNKGQIWIKKKYSTEINLFLEISIVLPLNF